MCMTDELKKIKLEIKNETKDIIESFFTNPLTKNDQKVLYETIHKQINFQIGTFPGCHNVTFMRKHFNNLLEEDYLCSEKSDGKRILLLIINLNLLETNKLNNQEIRNIKIFFIDRTNNIFIQKELKIKIKEELIKRNNEYFLFDCELIKTFNNQIRLYIFDTLIFFNKSVCNENLLNRLNNGKIFLKYFNIEYNLNDSIKNDFFKIHLKEMYKSYGFYEIYNNINKLNHKNDGLCFTPIMGKYSIGIDLNWLKWKPSNLNTIDFLVYQMNPINDKIFTSSVNINKSINDIINKSTDQLINNLDDIIIYGLFVNKTDGSLVFFDYYIPYYDILSKEIKKGDNINNTICEFQFNEDIIIYSLIDDCFIKGGWTLYKIRRDKNKPNTVKIAKNIMVAINEKINFKDLELKYKEMKNNWKNRNP